MTLLIDNPRVHRQLCENLALLATVVEEMLRLDPPFHLIVRKVVKPATRVAHPSGGTHRAKLTAFPVRAP
jgi:cytochrome P450